MNIDPTEAVKEIASVWQSSPLIIGSQLLIIVLLGLTVYDRFETRRTVLDFVTGIMNQQNERSEIMAQRQEKANGDMILRLNHLTDTLTATIIDCYRHEQGGELALPPSEDRGSRNRPRPPTVSLPE